jgi:exo-beta-1,3-glucanase (GH17 family)
MSRYLWALLSLWTAVSSFALDAPASLTATTMSASRVDLSWTAVVDADRYEVERSVAFNVWSPVGEALTNAFSDTGVAAGNAYLYRVRAADGVVLSSYGAPAIASTFAFTDDPIVPGLLRPKTAHVTELRTVANTIRTLAGLSAGSYGETIVSGVVVKAPHILELRTALNPARAALGLPALAYAKTLVSGVTPIRAVDVVELRAGATGRSAQFWSSVGAMAGVQSLAGRAATILAGTSGNGVYQSTDHGQNFSQANTGLATLNVGAVAIADDGSWLAGLGGGSVHRSTNGGTSWAPAGASPPQNVTTLLIAKDGVYAASCNGISFTTDFATWIPRNNGLTNVCVSSMAVAPDGDLFAGTVDGVFRSQDGGGSWTAVNTGLSSPNVHAVAVDALGRVFAATHAGGVFVSSNDGANWSASLLPAADIFALFLDPTDELFAGGEGNGASVFRSSDSVAWSSAHDRLPRATKINAFGATSRYRFVALDGSVFRAPGEFRLHGLNFGPYLTESVGTFLSEEEVKKRMQVLRGDAKWVRNFGMNGGLEKTGLIAHRLGLKAALSAHITGNATNDAAEITSLINAANAGEADLLIVGSEIIRKREACGSCNFACTEGCVTDSQLIAYIDQVEAGINNPAFLVGTAELHDRLLNHPGVMNAGTVVLANYYPWFHGIAVEHAVETLDDWHQLIVAAAGGRPVVVSETGWPSAGTQRGDAIPNETNAAFYFSNFVSWARSQRVPYFYFEAFDESWKSGEPDGVGTHWGLRTTAAALKPGMDATLAGDTIADNWSGLALIGGLGTPSIDFTNVPPYGNTTQLLRGTVAHIRPAEYRIAVYINVAGGWWTKPEFANPLTTIYADGTWTCDIVTGGSDQNATQIAAFVIPVGYDPPQLDGDAQIPQQLYDDAPVEIVHPRPPP